MRLPICVRGAVLVLGFASLAVSCDDGGGDRPIGAVCTANGQCSGGVCGGGVCLDPAGDSDGDSLINEIEAALGTDPVVRDSDADGVDDPTEVSDHLAPPDRDGDGKIDAVESAIADADGDCIVDEEDPRDGISDPPSEQFPQACGGAESCGDSPLDGTCAEALGEMIFECFAPAGACTHTTSMLPGDGGSTTWANGAAIAWTLGSGGLTGEVYSADGQICGVILSQAGDEGPARIRVQESGPEFTAATFGGSMQIGCPDGQSVVLEPAATERVDRCSGLTAQARCQVVTPHSCTSDAECEPGLCCEIPDQPMAPRMCMSVEVCPASPP